jgi:hypothetical protein
MRVEPLRPGKTYHSRFKLCSLSLTLVLLIHRPILNG